MVLGFERLLKRQKHLFNKSNSINIQSQYKSNLSLRNLLNHVIVRCLKCKQHPHLQIVIRIMTFPSVF